MQKEIQLTDKTLLMVGFNTTNPIFIQSGLTSEDPIAFKLEYNLASTETIVIPDGDWQLLGIYPELTEEMAKMVVERLFFAEAKPYPYYVNYTDETYYCGTALESFQSLMEREKCYTVNPYGDYFADLAYGGDTHTPTFEQWQEAEQRTFSKYVILIKSK